MNKCKQQVWREGRYAGRPGEMVCFCTHHSSTCWSPGTRQTFTRSVRAAPTGMEGSGAAETVMGADGAWRGEEVRQVGGEAVKVREEENSAVGVTVSKGELEGQPAGELQTLGCVNAKLRTRNLILH